MSDPHSPKAISALVQKAVTNLLHAKDVYSLDSYGWLSADDVDPELIGHAMWQTDSLSFRVVDALAAARESRAAPFPELEPWQRFLISTGGDFEGLMDAARLSIGLALFQREAGDTGRFGEESLFQLHLIAALVTLGAASDRLRDVFVATTFHDETRGYERGKWRKKGDRRYYETPFSEAVEQLPSLPDSVAKLPALAAQIHSFRQARNAVVHELATEYGRVASEIANSPRPPTYREVVKNLDVHEEYAKVLRRAQEMEAEDLRRIAEKLDRPIQWYKLLIQASNHVFIVENTIRRERERQT